MFVVLNRWWHSLKIDESKGLIYKKFKDHRLFTANVFLFGAFLGVILWIWDYITDPVGAKETIGFRCFFLILLIEYVLLRKWKNPYMLGWLALFFTLLTLVDYLLILTHLEKGMIYGIAGFMFYMLLPPIAFQAFPLWINIISIMIVAAFPQLFAEAGFVNGFQQANYAVLIWPAASIAIIIQYFYARNYRHRYEMEKSLERLSYTDMLSGLYNRRYFMETFHNLLEHAKASGTSLGLLIADIDRFKSINDQYGHPVGDEVIKSLSALFAKEVGAAGIVARIGGEEFGILLPDTDREASLKLAEQLRSSAEEMNIDVVDEEQFVCTISIGIAVSEANSDVSTLFKKADQALYKAKQSGRNCIYRFS